MKRYLLLIAGAATFLVFLASLGAIVHSYRVDVRKNAELVASSGLLALRLEGDATQEAADRIATASATIRQTREGDPFDFVVALNRRLAEDRLDFGYVFLRVDGRWVPWVEGATLTVARGEEALSNDRAFSSVLDLSPERRYLADEGGLFALGRSDIVSWDEPIARIIVGRRITAATFDKYASRPVSLAVLSGDQDKPGEKPVIGVGSVRWDTRELAEAIRFKGPSGLRLAVRPESIGIFSAILRAAFVLVFLIGVAWLYVLRTLRVARVREEHAKASLRNLMQQMNPHFLFNALNAISSATERNPGAVRPMVEELAALYRRILDAMKKEFVPLSEELGIVEAYLRIQGRRFEDRLAWKIENRLPDAASVSFPPLLLQTLVENAVKHGIAESLTGGAIELSLCAEGTGVRVRVRNSGEPLHPRWTPGIGIESTRKRLELCYGGDAEFSLTAAPDGWTEASFMICGTGHLGGAS